MENEKVQLIADDEIITLTGDDGTEVDFYEVAVVDHEDALYAILEPAQPLDDIEEGEVLIFKIEDNTDPDAEDDIFTVVEDETLLQAVFDEYLKAVAASNSECEDDCDECSSAECDECDMSDDCCGCNKK